MKISTPGTRKLLAPTVCTSKKCRRVERIILSVLTGNRYCSLSIIHPCSKFMHFAVFKQDPSRGGSSRGGSSGRVLLRLMLPEIPNPGGERMINTVPSFCCCCHSCWENVSDVSHLNPKPGNGPCAENRGTYQTSVFSVA